MIKCKDNRDRETPRGVSPPTPPCVRVTYTAVRLIKSKFLSRQALQTKIAKELLREGKPIVSSPTNKVNHKLTYDLADLLASGAIRQSAYHLLESFDGSFADPAPVQSGGECKTEKGTSPRSVDRTLVSIHRQLQSTRKKA